MAVLYAKIACFAKSDLSVHNGRMFGISKQKKRVYLDYAGATPVVPEATKAVFANMRLFANPSAIHTQAVEAAQSLTASRERVAHHFGCKSRDIIFTSGGTESNNPFFVWLDKSHGAPEPFHFPKAIKY